MDNIAHALTGAVIGECAVPSNAPRFARRVLVVAGALAANAPDIDVLYTGITEHPIGYLLHHRGHSHTFPGLMVLGGVLWGVLRFWPAAREQGTRRALVGVIAAGLISHLLMDAANSYGTHLLYPFSSGWLYGDAVFVLEPWVWLIAGLALTLNAVRWWRLAAIVPAAAPIAAMGIAGLITPGVFAMLAAGAAGIAVVTRPWRRRTRAIAAVTAITVLFVGMYGVSGVARAEARRVVSADGSPDADRIVDLVLNPNPAMPWCWMVIALERDDEGLGEGLVARRGTMTLLPRLTPAAACASARLAARAGLGAAPASGAFVWHQEWSIDLARLRALYLTDCRARAWMQFARVPHVSGDRIEDLRFAEPFGGSFGWMALAPDAPGCPKFLTNWTPPRFGEGGRGEDK